MTLAGMPSSLNVIDTANIFYSIDLATGNVMMQHNIPVDEDTSGINALLASSNGDLLLLGINRTVNGEGGIPELWTYDSYSNSLSVKSASAHSTYNYGFQSGVQAYDPTNNRVYLAATVDISTPAIVTMDFNAKTETVVEFPYVAFASTGAFDPTTQTYYYSIQTSVGSEFNLISYHVETKQYTMHNYTFGPADMEDAYVFFYNGKLYVGINTESSAMSPSYVVEIDLQAQTSKIILTIPGKIAEATIDVANFVLDAVNGYIIYLNNPSGGKLDVYFLNLETLKVDTSILDYHVLNHAWMITAQSNRTLKATGSAQTSRESVFWQNAREAADRGNDVAKFKKNQPQGHVSRVWADSSDDSSGLLFLLGLLADVDVVNNSQT
eukprot:gene7224-8392_t